MNFLTKSKFAFLAALLVTASAQTDNMPTVTVACGDLITKSVIIGNDLNCPETTDYALRISGENIHVHGAGHKIMAPKAAAAIFAQGSGLKITNFISTGNSKGFGLMANNTPKIQIFENDFSKNQNGITLYADNTLVDGVVIEKNKITESVEFGVRLTFGDSGKIENPKITENDLRNTGEWAIYVMAASFEITGADNNNFWGSKNGYYLKDGAFNIHDADFSDQLIIKRTIFVDSAKSVIVKNVNVSSRSVNMCTEERVGIDFYRVIKFTVDTLVSTAGDVGLQLETESGVATEGEVVNSSLTNHIRGGIAIVSHDTTKYGKVVVDKTRFCEPKHDIYIDRATKIGVVHHVQPDICPDVVDRSCN
ncbi:hypothetical protein CIK05_01695 [Bdellovibrio sp. qaytius]|nr:hypothetical protein CIK05_01695 [Bdellovibrio sp. qaytius]